MTAEATETIRIDRLSIGYPGKDSPHVVANRIHTSLVSGELTCLLGANGAGKSTLLRTLSAVQPSLSGSIYLQGRDMKSYTSAELAMLISVVLTDRCEVEGMKVYELVALGRTPYTNFWGKLDDEDKVVVERSLQLVGIEHLAKRRVQTLSDGERQKVMIAKALAQETPVILLDEPTAFLDYPSKVDMMQLLRHLSRETDKAILMSTHDLELALQIADKIWLMERSKELLCGTPEDLALSGCLSHFFKRKGIAFDQNTGLFAVDYDIEHHIGLQGDQTYALMVKKALARNGIDADAHNVSCWAVEASDTGFRLLRNGEECGKASDVNGLLVLLRKIKF